LIEALRRLRVERGERKLTVLLDIGSVSGTQQRVLFSEDVERIDSTQKEEGVWEKIPSRVKEYPDCKTVGSNF